MCAWKRGTQNNLPGLIRKGHIREFLVQSSCRENLVTGKLRVLEHEQLCVDHTAALSIATASICTPEHGLPEQFMRFVLNGVLYLHSHEYPRSVLTAVLDEDVPHGSIILNQVQRINNKVCSGELQEWSIFSGDVSAYDCTEGSMGNHSKVYSSKAPPVLQSICLEVSVHGDCGGQDCSPITTISCKIISMKYTASLFHCVVTTDDVYVVYEHGVAVVGRVVDVTPEQSLDDEFFLPDNYRGVVDESTIIYIVPTSHDHLRVEFIDVPSIPVQPPMNDIVQIISLDGEVFPVKRKLLRPCIALTSLVQAGKGKYCKALEEDGAPASEGVARVDVDACTFDRVLLYLEHEARGEAFHFDPLLANELRTAALTLGISGLRDTCDRVLGSFQERVRRSPIRLAEVYARNAAGGTSKDVSSDDDDLSSRVTKRSETWLLMSGNSMT